MDRVPFGKTGLLTSKVALGGIPMERLSKKDAVRMVEEVLDLGVNFIDTAHGYTGSEEKIGEAIRGRKREDLIIASKSPAADKKTFLEHVDLSLRRLGIDYIDIYHFHNVASEERRDQVMGPGGAYEGLQEVIQKGKVRYAAFSSHYLPEAKKLMLTGKFDVVQIAFNFVEWEAEQEIIPLARRMNLGIIAMKPMGGGLLGDAHLAFRYLAKFPDVIPDPGIERTEEMEEIIRIIENPRALTREEKIQMESICQELGREFCHRCEYCQPCPQGIPISIAVRVESFTKRMSFRGAAKILEPAVTKARECTECEECVARCPYNLAIPQLLKKNIAFWEEYERKWRKR